MLVAARPDLAVEIRAITVEGMEGRIPFRESVERRLALARPTREQALAFGESAVARLTPGMDSLVRGLPAEVWIVSGALLETLLPVARHLGVAEERVLGTRVGWTPDGPELISCGSKVDAAREAAAQWPRPRIGVGDGMTDHALLESGMVDHFVAFVGHARRESVAATGAPEARTVDELEYLLAGLLS